MTLLFHLDEYNLFVRPTTDDAAGDLARDLTGTARVLSAEARGSPHAGRKGQVSNTICTRSEAKRVMLNWIGFPSRSTLIASVTRIGRLRGCCR